MKFQSIKSFNYVLKLNLDKIFYYIFYKAPLHQAMDYNNTEIIKIILSKNGVDVNVKETI